jgi:hypothetical protein
MGGAVMAVTAAIVGSVAAIGGTTYGAIKANQMSQDAKGANSALLATQTSAAADAAASNAAAARAAAMQKKKAQAAQGYAATIATGPQGIDTPPNTGQRSTLLGL